MVRQTSVFNPFMLMVNPELVLAAVERSEPLGQLNRHLCRPLDKINPIAGEAGSDSMAECEADEAAETD